MPEIQIIAKDNHKTLVTTEGTSAKLSEASVVLVKVAASDVLVVNREGTNAVIRLKNGETIVIEGFFSGTAEPKDNSLVFQDENGQLIWAKSKMLKMMQMLIVTQMQMLTVMWNHKHF
nr:BapA prefix-like domain-containing protein [Acinetobacter baumannii]